MDPLESSEARMLGPVVIYSVLDFFFTNKQRSYNSSATFKMYSCKSKGVKLQTIFCVIKSLKKLADILLVAKISQIH